ncbi:MAG: hypothetical protein ACRC8S_08770 [Fimbriiglobus sp.]
MRTAWLTLCFSFLTLALGCGGGDKFNRQKVSGTVNLDGKAIPFGNIEFVPSEGQPTGETMEIKDGKFASLPTGGLSPGKYIIRVQGMDGPPPPPGDTPGATSGPLPKLIVPEKYGAKSTESATVKAGDKNEFTFALTSK